MSASSDSLKSIFFALGANLAIALAKTAGAVFTGSSLYLRIGPDGTAILSQGDRTNELRCSAGQAHA